MEMTPESNTLNKKIGGDIVLLYKGKFKKECIVCCF